MVRDQGVGGSNPLAPINRFKKIQPVRNACGTGCRYFSLLLSFLRSFRVYFQSRADLQTEILALRHQLQVLERLRPRRLRLTRTDRLLWIAISRIWRDWRAGLVIVRPETVIAWHRRGFRLFWAWKSRRRLGRPTVPADIRALIRTMSTANPIWGAPRIQNS